MDDRAGKTSIKSFSLYDEDIKYLESMRAYIGERASLSDCLRHLISTHDRMSHYMESERDEHLSKMFGGVRHEKAKTDRI